MSGLGKSQSSTECLRRNENFQAEAKSQESLGNKPSPSSYFNSDFAKYDTICGFGNNYAAESSQSQYQFDYQVPSSGGPEPGIMNGINDPGNFSINPTYCFENGAWNSNLPLVKSYPVVPTNSKSSNSKARQPMKERCSNAQTRSKSRGRCRTSQDKLMSRPILDPSRLVQQVENQRDYFGPIKISTQRDYDAGNPVPTFVLEYGQELLEIALNNLTKQTLKEKESKKLSTSSPDVSSCRDYGTPNFNSSAHLREKMDKVLDDLNRLPKQLERIIGTDQRFEPLINNKIKPINVPRDEHIFNNLISLDTNENVAQEIRKSASLQVKSVQPSRRSKDPEPNILNYQQPQYVSVAPGSIIPDSSLPISGISIDTRPHNSNHLIKSELEFEKESDQL